jgi:phosphate transport system permease protein
VKQRRSIAEPGFRLLTIVVATSLLFLTLLYFFELSTRSSSTLGSGLGFVTGSTWDPVNNVFGALPMLYGSLVTSAIGLAIGVPVSLGVAVFLAELAPMRLRSPLSFIIEMLAAVPSVVYGLWGLFVLSPVLVTYVFPTIQSYLGFLPIFSCPDSVVPCQFYGVSIFSAGIILSVMIIPIVSAISRDALLAVPASQREAAYALGATKSEVINMSVLSYARSGIIAAIFLGFGRAFGETMAVTFLIGNTPLISHSLFSPGYTLASLVANEFTEAIGPVYISALIEAGLLLLVVSFATSLIGRLLIRRFVKNREAASYL